MDETTSEQTEIETCFYCRKNPANPEYAYLQCVYENRTYKVHKDVINTPGGMMVDQVTMEKKYIKIPRCQECMKIHDSAPRLTNIADLTAGAVGGILALIIFWGHGAVWWMLLFTLVFMVASDLTFTKYLLRHKFASLGIKGYYDTKDHPVVADYLGKGWKFVFASDKKK
jgi:hypothetical protein